MSKDMMSRSQLLEELFETEYQRNDLLYACRDALRAIRSLPDDALGLSRYGDPNNPVVWSIRDELISKLEKAISRGEGNE